MATRPELHIAVAKTKSKASDYNDNFSMMMDYIDAVALEDKTYVDGFMPTVTGQSGKFLTNNGTTTSWASLGNQPFGDFINGLVITKSSDDTIAISKGSCYDYAKAVILTNATNTTKQNESQTASTTYYVYILDNADFLITTSSSSPTLPTGATTYRQIGYYTTDSNNKIDVVSFYGIDINSDKSVGNIIDACMPDYSAGINCPVGTDFTCPKSGWVLMSQYCWNSGAHYIKINSLSFVFTQSDGNYLDLNAIMIPVSAGDVINNYGANGTNYFIFYPAKGAN